MNVLVVDHSRFISGAQHAVLDLVAHAPEGLSLTVACPEGEFASRLRERGIEWLPLPGTSASARLDPVHTTRAIGELLASSLAVRRLSVRFDLVHANSVRAGLIALVPGVPRGRPVVVQLHDSAVPGHAARAAERFACRRAAAIVANSEHVARSVAPRRAAKVVLYNPLDVARFTPGVVDRPTARERLKVELEPPLIAVVGQLTTWKGQDDAIRILARIRATSQPEAELALVGSAKFSQSTRFNNASYVASLHALAEQLGVSDAVHFIGEREDVPDVLAAVDLLLVPSWDEPFGRVVTEAMAMALPVVATAIGGPSEVIEDGVTGRLLVPREPERWAEVVGELLHDRARREELGRRARTAVIERFDAAAYARGMVRVYTSALSMSGAA